LTPEELINQYRRALTDCGEDVAVRRYAGTGMARDVVQEAIARGRVAGLDAEDIVGDIKLSDRKVILLNDPDAAVPDGKVALSTLLPLRTTDKLLVRGRELSIDNVDDDTRRIAGVSIALEIIARG
jgi:hypothetical protein